MIRQRNRWRALRLAALSFVLAATQSQAALQFYGERLAFDSDNPRLPVEGFEEGVVDTNFDSPLDSSTDNAVFSPRNILPGLTVTTDPPGTNDLRVRQRPTTKLISTPSTLRQLVFEFSVTVTAVGLDVFQFNADGDVTIQVFGPGGLLGQTAVPTGQAGAFFGVFSDADPITHIILEDSDLRVGADDVAFALPEPRAGLVHGVALLSVLALARRRRSPGSPALSRVRFW